MGVYVQSHIIAERIEPDAWQALYSSTLEFLDRCPLEPMGLRRVPGRDGERRVYSRRIEQDAADPARRHWHLVGDLGSMQTGESFVLHADLGRYRGTDREGQPEPPEDILQALLPDGGMHWNVFSAKTQGEPYHLAMLAVAMLIEDAFPLHAAAGGDIDRAQAEAAREMIRDALGREVALPLCIDAERLMERIGRYVQGPDALDSFDALFRGERTELFRVAEPRVREAWIAAQLASYEKPTQLGAVQLAIQWLNADRDLESLCRICCLDDAGPRFDPVGLAELLAATWVTIPDDARSALAPFERPAGAADTVHTQLGMALMDMSGFTGRRIRRHIPRDQVLDLLGRLFPEQREPIQETLDECTAKTTDGLAQARAPVQALEQRSLDEVEIGDGASFLTFASVDAMTDGQRTPFRWFAYTAHKLLRMLPDELPESADWDIAEVRNMLDRAVDHLGLTLTEDAWAWIDAEEDRDLLALLLVLAGMGTHEQQFWNMRRALFERRAFAVAVLAASQDERLIAEVDAMVQRQAKAS